MRLMMTTESNTSCPYTPPEQAVTSATPKPSSLDDVTNQSETSNEAIPGLMEEGATLLSSVQLVIAKSLDLLAMETQRASLSLTWMFALASVLAVLVITAWLGLMAVLALTAVAYGWSWIAAILVLVAINSCAAVGVIFWCQQLSKDLLFAATRRQFAHRLVAQSSAL